MMMDDPHRDRVPYDCPIEWCAGSIGDHGGDGTEPEFWLHRGEDVELGDIGIFFDTQIGSGPHGGYVELRFDDEYTIDELRDFAKRLRGIADTLTGQADRIDA